MHELPPGVEEIVNLKSAEPFESQLNFITSHSWVAWVVVVVVVELEDALAEERMTAAFEKMANKQTTSA